MEEWKVKGGCAFKPPQGKEGPSSLRPSERGEGQQGTRTEDFLRLSWEEVNAHQCPSQAQIKALWSRGKRKHRAAGASRSPPSLPHSTYIYWPCPDGHPQTRSPCTSEHTHEIKRCSFSLKSGIRIELRFIIAPTSTFLRLCSSGSGQANATLPSFTRITSLVTFNASHSLLPSSDTSENSFHSFSILDYWITSSSRNW